MKNVIDWLRNPAVERLIMFVTRMLPPALVRWLCNLLGPRIQPTHQYNIARLAVEKLSKQYKEHRVAIERCAVPEMGKLVLPTSDNHFGPRKFGVYHPPILLNEIEKFVEEGQTVCELGPHLGEMMLFLRSLVGDFGKVYAFEMDPQYSWFIQKTVDENCFKNCVVENKAVYHSNKMIDVRDGYCDFTKWIENFPELAIAQYIGIRYFTSDPKDWNESEMRGQSFRDEPNDSTIIETVNLFDYFKNLEPVNLFFMDIEGAEVFAIPSIIRLASHWGSKPRIVFEYHKTYSGEQYKMLRDTLLDHQYKLFTPDNRHVFAV